MIIDPLQPIAPTDWMMLQEDQSPREIPTTPGLSGVQPLNTWLSLLVETVRLLVRKVFRIKIVVVMPCLLAVSWIQEKTGISPPRHIVKLFLSPLGGGM